MPNACIFCGDDSKRLTDEHVFPDWLHEYLKDDLVRFGEHQRTAMSGEVTSWPTRTFDLKAKIVCHDCNHGWLATLEGRVKPLLTEMMWGRSSQLTVAKQRLLAFWACKTAAVAQHVNPPERAMPDAHYRELYDRQQAIAGATVLTGRSLPRQKSDTVVGFTEQITSDVSSYWPPRAPVRREPRSAYMVTFRLGALVFELIYGIEALPPTDRSLMERIWPPTGRFDWPPAAWIEGDLRNFHQRFWVPIWWDVP